MLTCCAVALVGTMNAVQRPTGARCAVFLPWRPLCYNDPVITYSREDMERQLRTDQTLWQRVPGPLAAVLWPLEVVLLGWGTGAWTGVLTVAALGVASVALPPRLRINIYIVDLLDQAVRLPLNIGWLLLVWHLALREPLFAIFGQPLIGAIAVAASLLVATRLLVLATRLATRRMAARFSR